MLLMLILMLFARGESDAKLSLKKPHMMNFSMLVHTLPTLGTC